MARAGQLKGLNKILRNPLLNAQQDPGQQGSLRLGQQSLCNAVCASPELQKPVEHRIRLVRRDNVDAVGAKQSINALAGQVVTVRERVEDGGESKRARDANPIPISDVRVGRNDQQDLPFHLTQNLTHHSNLDGVNLQAGVPRTPVRIGDHHALKLDVAGVDIGYHMRDLRRRCLRGRRWRK